MTLERSVGKGTTFAKSAVTPPRRSTIVPARVTTTNKKAIYVTMSEVAD